MPCGGAGHPRHRRAKHMDTCEGAHAQYCVFLVATNVPAVHRRPRCRIGLALPVRWLLRGVNCRAPWRCVCGARTRTPRAMAHACVPCLMATHMDAVLNGQVLARSCTRPPPPHSPTHVHAYTWPPPPPPRCPPASPRVTSRNVAQMRLPVRHLLALPRWRLRLWPRYGIPGGCPRRCGRLHTVREKSPPSHPHASPSISPVFPTQITQPAGLLKDHTALLDRVSKNVEEAWTRQWARS